MISLDATFNYHMILDEHANKEDATCPCYFEIAADCGKEKCGLKKEWKKVSQERRGKEN